MILGSQSNTMHWLPKKMTSLFQKPLLVYLHDAQQMRDARRSSSFVAGAYPIE